MFKVEYIFSLLLLVSACTTHNTPNNHSLINTSHLEHLYQVVNIDNDISIGTIWIYSNAPDYHLLTDDDEGFTCVDDVSRTLVFYCRQYVKEPSKENLGKIESFSGFLMYMKAENDYYFNFLFPDNEINKLHPNSLANPNFWSWRALWALTELNLLESTELDSLKNQTLPYIDLLLSNIQQLFSSESDTVVFDGIQVPSVVATYGSDQLALIMISLTNYYQLNNSPLVKDLLLKLGHYLMSVQYGDENTFPYYAFLSWKNNWHAWGNSQSYALLYTGRIIQNEQFINAGLNELKYFFPYCIEQNLISRFSVVRKKDSLLMVDFQQFPQIAYGLRPMIFALLEANEITGDECYAIQAGNLATWFFGNNPTKQVMYDQLTGRTFDGIDSSNKTNFNSGAESTIETLLSLQAIESNIIARQIVLQHLQKITLYDKNN